MNVCQVWFIGTELRQRLRHHDGTQS